MCVVGREVWEDEAGEGIFLIQHPYHPGLYLLQPLPPLVSAPDRQDLALPQPGFQPMRIEAYALMGLKDTGSVRQLEVGGWCDSLRYTHMPRLKA